MHSILKVSAISIVSATLFITTGCTNQRGNSGDFVVSPTAVPGNAAYQTAPLIANSAEIQAAAQNLRGVVHFAFDSSAINDQAASVLNEQLAFLSQNPEARVLIAGHTDERGSREYNQALGERRAQAVRTYLASQGVNNVRIETISYGEERPIAMGNDEASHAQNRRAELSY